MSAAAIAVALLSAVDLLLLLFLAAAAAAIIAAIIAIMATIAAIIAIIAAVSCFCYYCYYGQGCCLYGALANLQCGCWAVSDHHCCHSCHLPLLSYLPLL